MSKSNMNLKLVAGLLVASSSTAAIASMNNLNVQSHLGERFTGTIVVTGPTAQEILSSPSSVKISGAPISARVSKQGNSAVIHLRSKAPINEPVLQLNVQAGTQSRQYSAIIDPKDSIHKNAQVNASKAIPAVPTTAADNAQVTTAEKPAVKTPVAADKTTTPITSNADANSAKPTTAPTANVATPAPKVAKRTIQNNRDNRRTRQKTTAVAAPVHVAAAEQYKVQPNDTIYGIASRFQPEGLSTAQTAQALMRANPQAFRNKNANLLYGDATLNIPSSDDIRALATGRSVKKMAPVPATPNTQANTTSSDATKLAATTAAAGTAAIGAQTISSNRGTASNDDIKAIQQQLADLETQKKQLEQKLARELAEAEAAKKAAATEKEAEQKAKAAEAAAKAQADEQATQTAAKAQADEQAAKAKEEAVAKEAAAQNDALAASTPVAASAPVIAAPVAQASEPTAASAPVVKAAPKPKKPLPEPTPEPSLLDLIMQNLPYLAGGVVLLLLAAWLLKQRRSKSNGDDTDPDGGNGDNGFNEDDFKLDDLDNDVAPKSNPSTKLDDNNLTAAELDALASFDNFQMDDEALHQATAKPTAAPSQISKQDINLNKTVAGAAVVGGAAMAGAAYATTMPDDDFMPSAEELKQYAQPDATVAPELDDFNLDDLDGLFQSPTLQTQPTAAAKSAMAADSPFKEDLDDFDLNELDNLLQKNGFGDQTPAPIQSFSSPKANDDLDLGLGLNFDLDEVMQINESMAKPSAAHDFDFTADTSKEKDSQIPSFDDFNLDELTQSLDDFPAAALQKTPIQPKAAAVDDFDPFADLDLNTPASPLANNPMDDGVFNINASDAGLTLSQEDISDINFDAFNLDTVSETLSPTTAPEKSTLNVAPLAAVAASVVIANEVAANDNPPSDDDFSFDLYTSAPLVETTAAPIPEATVDNDFNLNLDALFEQSDDDLIPQNSLNINADDQPSADSGSDDDFVSKFSSISLESEHNQLAFDDSFSDLNFDDLLKTDDLHNEPAIVADTATPNLSDFSELEDNQTDNPASEFPVHDFKDFSIDTPSKAERPAQAWAGTGDFGLSAEEESALKDAAIEEAEAFDFGNLDLDDLLDAEHLDAPTKANNSLDVDALDLSSLMSQDETAVVVTHAAPENAVDEELLNVAAFTSTTANEDTALASSDSVESIDLALSDGIFDLNDTTPILDDAIVAEEEIDDLGFDLNLDGMSFDLEPPTQPAPTATPDIIANEFDFSDDDNAVMAPQEAVSTPEPEISESLSLDDFDSLLDVPTETQAPNIGLSLDDFDLSFDLNDVAQEHQAATESDTISLNDFDLSFDNGIVQDAQAATPTPDISLDDFDLSFDLNDVAPSNDINGSSNTVSLDDFDLSFADTTVVPETQAATPTPEIALDDFDLSFDLNTLELTHSADANAANTDASLDDFDLSFDVSSLASNHDDQSNIAATAAPFSLDNLMGLDNALETSPALDLPTTAPTAAPTNHAPLAMIETAPPILDKEAHMNSMDHTYSTKWDLAQMYLDLGDSDSLRETLVDLIENGSETYAKRAQDLYNTL